MDIQFDRAYEIARFEELCSELIISEEGLSSVGNIIKRLLMASVDILAAVPHSFFHTVANIVPQQLIAKYTFGKVIADGPLGAFEANHHLSVFAFYRSDLIAYNNIKVSKPRSLKGSYNDVIASQKNHLSALDMKGLAKNILSIAKDVDKTLDTTSTQPIELNHLVDAFNKRAEDIKKMSKDHDKIFSAKGTGKEIRTSFASEFGTMEEFKRTVKAAKGNFTHVRPAADVFSVVERIEKVMREILLKTDNVTLSKESSKALVKFSANAADVVAFYGNLIITEIIVEYNLLNVLENLMTVYKKSI